MTDAELLHQLTDELKPMADELATDSEVAKTRMQKIVNDLSDAIRAKNGPLIQLHLKSLYGLMGDYAALVKRGEALVDRVARLQAEDERSNVAKALATLTRTLGERQPKLENNYDKLKEMQELANKTLGQANAEAARVERAWADMEAYLATNAKLFDTRLKEITLLEQLAQAAMKERDRNDLAKIQSRNAERTAWKPTVGDIDARLIGFFGNNGDKLPASLREQFTADRVKFNKILAALDAIDKKIDAHYKAIKSLALKPIDPRKAADAMEIPKGNDAKVKKALDSSPLGDALETLAREAKMKVSGTELMNRLRKAHLV